MSETEEQAPEFDPFAAPASKKGRGGVLIALLALALAVAVSGWNAWLWWQDREGQGAAVAMTETLRQLSSGQADLVRTQRQQSARLDTVERLELESGLAQLDEALAQARSVAGSDRARLASMEGALAETMSLLNRLESRVAAIVVRGESPRQGLELAEVDYLLRSANERLRLYGDARSAAQALALADAQLEAMDDPVYLTVRQSIAAASLAIESVQRPDMVALTEGLSSLQAQIPGLPFPGEVIVASPTGPLVAEDPGLWARFKGAMSSLVTVRREEQDLLLISLEDKDTVRQALWLQLEAARLALLREDDSAYQSALQRANATLAQYFDKGADAFARFEAGLIKLRATSLAVDWPDIAEPWTRLKGIRDTSVPTSPAMPASSPVPAAVAPAQSVPAAPDSEDSAPASVAESNLESEPGSEPEPEPEPEADSDPEPGPEPVLVPAEADNDT